MSPTSRRIYLYWLLLLVPTLVVGGAAVLLLRREQQRIARQGAYAAEASRAAVATRARLVVETVELIIGDVQTGLIDALVAEPPEAIDAFMTQWEKSNPLVRTAFRSTPEGKLTRPDSRLSDEDGRGFLRRFAPTLSSRPPWASTPSGQATVTEKKEQDRPAEEPPARQELSRNVSQAQSARRDVQELLKISNYVSTTLPAAESKPTQGADDTSGQLGERAQSANVTAPLAADEKRSSDGVASRSPAGASAPSLMRPEGKPTAPPASPVVNRTKDASLDRRGWETIVIDGKPNLVGWVQPVGANEVRGVELNLAALVTKLGGALPTELAEGEGYALRDDQGRVLLQSGAISRTLPPAVQVPLAPTLLPNWEVVGFLTNGSGAYSAGTSFFSVGMLLVAIFVAAILAGGSLLLWQARRSEEEAAQKTSFVANVSHEFKTPLTTIRLYSELLEQGRVRDAAQGGEYLRTIGRETQRLARLVNNALDFSRLEQGRKKYARESIDLSELLGRLLDTHAPRLVEAGLLLTRELPGGEVRVNTDRDAVEQIVLNLIDNACKYAAEGGELTVALTAQKNGGAEVRVSDRGPGVPAEHRERVFEKFHRVDDALTAEKTGAGLGLSIARQLARGLGGDLRYAARAGAGAEFVLELS